VEPGSKGDGTMIASYRVRGISCRRRSAISDFNGQLRLLRAHDGVLGLVSIEASRRTANVATKRAEASFVAMFMSKWAR
jgi:hypothetical protein